MPTSPLSPHVGTPQELKDRIAIERAGRPFLVYRDEQDTQRLLVPAEETDSLTIGRGPDCSITVEWDAEVSSLHAELRRVGGSWLLVDDGLSRNGTFVNGTRVTGRRRLGDHDQIQIGQTMVVYRDPLAQGGASTHAAGGGGYPDLSPAQRRVLVALCRPYGRPGMFAKPATNQEIADELSLTVAAVKTHLRTLFERFEVGDLRQNEKRVRLAQVAIESGAVSPADLVRPPA